MSFARKFDVRIGNLLVNVVRFDANMTAREVLNALIEHDGMSPNISVYKSDERGVAYEDCARASHPEEI
jgi:hypothetical protein